VGVGVCVGGGAVVGEGAGLGIAVGVPVLHRLTRNPVVAAAVTRRKSRLDIGRCCEFGCSIVFLDDCLLIILGLQCRFLSAGTMQPEQPPCIGGGRLCERIYWYAFDVCDALGNVGEIGRFVPLSPVGNWGQIGAIRLQQ